MKFDTLSDILIRHGITGVRDRGRIAEALPFSVLGPEQLETFLTKYGREALFNGLFEVKNGREFVVEQIKSLAGENR